MTAAARLPRTTRNPYRVPRPAVISFSGGRTSGFMLRKILDAYDGRLPSDIAVVYANTGMERPETLDFVDTCAAAWSITVHWVEYDWDAPHRTRVVDYSTASRNGQPYAALIDRKGFVPNVTTKFCSSFLKRDRIDLLHPLPYRPQALALGDRPARRRAAPRVEDARP